MRKFLFGIGILSLAGLVFLLSVGCGSDDDPVVGQPVACSIEVFGPTLGEIITTPATDETPETDRVDIEWNADGGGDVQIELLKGGDPVGVLHEDVENSGYNWWYVDDMVTGSGDDYQVRVSHLTSGDCGDTGPMFTIRDLRDCSIDLTIDYPTKVRDYPAEAGDVMTINWVPTSTTGSYDVELWQDTVGDVLVGVIAEDVTANEVVDGWVIDSFHVGDSWYYVKVQDREIGSCAGISETFEMVDNVLCNIRVISPWKDAVLPKGSQRVISWEAENNKGLLDIELYFYDKGYNRVDNILLDVDPDDGAYTWTVDDFNYPGENIINYMIKFSDQDDPYCFQYSEAFTITR